MAELIEPPRWQRLQDHFASVLGLPLRTITPSHDLLVNPSWPVSLDAERTIRLLKVGEELEQLVPRTRAPQEPSSVTTPFGVTYAVVPIRATADQVVAYVVVGPMMVGPREEELQFRQRVEGMGLEAQTLWPLVLSLKLYTFASIRSALNLMEEVSAAVVQLAYQAKALRERMPITRQEDSADFGNRADRVLRVLLETATMATRADGGSVMRYDPSRETLQVHLARGLSEAVIAQAQVKTGEGLAGLAAKQGAILLVDRDTSDERLTRRMHRPELVSSLVAPFVLDVSQNALYVLSLRTTDLTRRFTQEHV